MSRQIYVLDVNSDALSGNIIVTAAFWLTAPAARVVPVPSFVTAVRPLSPTAPNGYTSAELDALRAGTIVEKVTTVFVASTSQTSAGIQAALQSQYNTTQTAFTATGFAAGLVGSSWNGSTWTNGP